MAEYVPVSPAATFTGVQSATGVTVSGPGPESPLVRPLPYSMWAPPVKGAGRVTVWWTSPLESAAYVHMIGPVGESIRKSTVSPGVNPNAFSALLWPG